jgi:glucokinase
MARENLKTRVVGVDIEKEVTAIAVVDIRGNILTKESFPTGDNPNVADFTSRLSENIVNMVESHGGYESIRSVGISAPSGNFLMGSIVNSPNMPWKGVVPMAAMLRDRLGLAVALGNNAHARAIGEHAYGAAHGLKNFILVTLGSGLGSCFFSDGRPHLGMDGFTGEIGHSCIKIGGRQCGCGNKGCLEMYTSSKGIVMTAMEVLAESSEPSLMREAELLNYKRIIEFCREGDALARETFRRVGELLGIGLANYATVVNPEAIIFTGKVMHADEWLMDPMETSFNEHVFRNIQGKVKFLTSALEEDEMDLLGASALAWEVEEYSLFK